MTRLLAPCRFPSRAAAFVITAAASCGVVVAGLAVSTPAAAMGIQEPATPAKPAGKPAAKPPAAKPGAAKPDTAKPGDAKPRDAEPADTPADRKSDLEFRRGYTLAYDAIYGRQDYAAGIAILTTLGQDDHPDVANLIGFANRKLGRMDDAQVWYERALAADPRHTRTWHYYGMWHLERGARTQAEQHLRKIEAICGTSCEDYRSLQTALTGGGGAAY